MKTTATILIATATIACVSLISNAAEPIKLATLTVGKNTYTGAVVTKADDATAKIMHSAGLAKVPIEKLPASVQASLGYDPEKAKAITDANRAADEAAAQRDAEASVALAKSAQIDRLPSIRFKVENNFEDGITVVEMAADEDSHGPPIVGSMGSVGGGGYDTRKAEPTYHWDATSKRAFFPHTEQTKTKSIGSEFTAKVRQEGAHRTFDQDVVPSYAIVRMEPNQPAKAPPK